jgi:hypothetical protein
MPTSETYSNILRRTAEPWGVTLPDQGLLEDEDIPRPTVSESMEWHGDHGWQWCKIQLVALNGLWSYAANFSGNGIGGGFGPYLKFCKPVSTREQALADAIYWLKQRGATDDRELGAWLEGMQPLQPSLF